MTQNHKVVEASTSSQGDQSHIDSPPVYTPRASSPGTPIHPASSSTPPPSTVVPERVHVPTAPFSTNLVDIGPEPTNVICPRCHYGVRTSTRSRAGTHAGYFPLILLSYVGYK